MNRINALFGNRGFAALVVVSFFVTAFVVFALAVRGNSTDISAWFAQTAKTLQEEMISNVILISATGLFIPTIGLVIMAAWVNRGAAAGGVQDRRRNIFRTLSTILTAAMAIVLTLILFAFGISAGAMTFLLIVLAVGALIIVPRV